MKAEFDGVVNTSHPFRKFHFWKFQLVEMYIYEPYCVIDHLLKSHQIGPCQTIRLTFITYFQSSHIK